MERVPGLREHRGMLSPNGKERQPTQHNARIAVPSELNDSLTTIGGHVDTHPALDNHQALILDEATLDQGNSFP